MNGLQRGKLLEFVRKFEASQDEAVEYIVDKPEIWKILLMFPPYAPIVHLTRRRYLRCLCAAHALVMLTKLPCMAIHRDVFKVLAKEMLNPFYVANPQWDRSSNKVVDYLKYFVISLVVVFIAWIIWIRV